MNLRLIFSAIPAVCLSLVLGLPSRATTNGNWRIYSRQGLALYATAKYKDSIRNYEQAAKLLENDPGRADELADILLDIAKVNLDSGDIASADKVLQSSQLKEALRSTSDELLRARYYRRLHESDGHHLASKSAARSQEQVAAIISRTFGHHSYIYVEESSILAQDYVWAEEAEHALPIVAELVLDSHSKQSELANQSSLALKRIRLVAQSQAHLLLGHNNNEAKYLVSILEEIDPRDENLLSDWKLLHDQYAGNADQANTTIAMNRYWNVWKHSGGSSRTSEFSDFIDMVIQRCVHHFEQHSANQEDFDEVEQAMKCMPKLEKPGQLNSNEKIQLTALYACSLAAQGQPERAEAAVDGLKLSPNWFPSTQTLGPFVLARCEYIGPAFAKQHKVAGVKRQFDRMNRLTNFCTHISPAQRKDFVTDMAARERALLTRLD